MVACCHAAAGLVHGQSFSLRLDTIGHFPRAQVAWVAPSEIPPALGELVSNLNDLLTEKCGFAAETAPYRPHVTLLRDVGARPVIDTIEPIEWCVNRFCLLESHIGMPYEILHEYPMGQG